MLLVAFFFFFTLFNSFSTIIFAFKLNANIKCFSCTVSISFETCVALSLGFSTLKVTSESIGSSMALKYYILIFFLFFFKFGTHSLKFYFYLRFLYEFMTLKN